MFTTPLPLHPAGQKVKLDLLRGSESLSLALASSEEAHESDHLADLIHPNTTWCANWASSASPSTPRPQKCCPVCAGLTA